MKELFYEGNGEDFMENCRVYKMSDEFIGMTDEQIDERYRPRPMNPVKSLADSYAWRILAASTTFDTPMSVSELCRLLAERDVEIFLSYEETEKLIYTLCDAGQGICYDSKRGAWYDCEYDYFNPNRRIQISRKTA